MVIRFSDFIPEELERNDQEKNGVAVQKKLGV